MYDTLINRISHHAKAQPDKMAVVFKGEQLTYSALMDKIRLVGDNLNQMGVKKGDRVLFTALSKPEMAAVYLGIQFCGAVAVFLDKNATVGSMEFVYHDTDAVLLLTDKPMKGVGEDVRVCSRGKI